MQRDIRIDYDASHEHRMRHVNLETIQFLDNMDLLNGFKTTKHSELVRAVMILCLELVHQLGQNNQVPII